MNYYKILKINRLIKNDRIKILGIGLLFLLRRRFFNVFLDPILLCNYKCVMCYFSDPNYKPNKTPLSKEMIEKVAKSFFNHALKLQIGCGAEPSLYKYNSLIIEQAKKYNVPHISFTTNGSLLDFDKISLMAESGLDEIILSLHGTTKEVYEKMMPGGSFEKLHDVLKSISKVKLQYPEFKLRINYTVNPDNIQDLRGIVDYLDDYSVDTLQVRPIRKLGDSVYTDFDIKRKQEEYARIINEIHRNCEQNNVVSLLTKKLPDENLRRSSLDIAKYTYCYVSPIYFGEEDFKPNGKSYYQFLRSNGFFKSIIRKVFFQKNTTYNSSVNFGNYDVNV
ncbi:MAG: radical SAM protein [Bacteroidales bacterium]